MVNKLILALALVVSGCASYQFGGISKSYCAEADPAIKAVLKAKLISAGVVLPVDYCASVGLIDVIVTENKG